MSGSILANLGLGGGQAGVPGAASPSVLQMLMGGGAPGAIAAAPQHPIGFGANGFPTGISPVFANQGGGQQAQPQAPVGPDPLAQALAAGDAMNKAAYGTSDMSKTGLAYGVGFPSGNDPRLIQDRLSQYLQQAGAGQGGIVPGQMQGATGNAIPSGLMQMLAQYYLTGMMPGAGGAPFGGYGGGMGGGGIGGAGPAGHSGVDISGIGNPGGSAVDPGVDPGGMGGNFN